MTPQERREFEELKIMVKNLQRVEDVSFIENIRRRIDLEATARLITVQVIANTSINDLRDVDVPSPSNGQVLKYTTSGTDRWIAGTDNI